MGSSPAAGGELNALRRALDGADGAISTLRWRFSFWAQLFTG
jgi:hypothetical protein